MSQIICTLIGVGVLAVIAGIVFGLCWLTERYKLFGKIMFVLMVSVIIGVFAYIFGEMICDLLKMHKI